MRDRCTPKGTEDLPDWFGPIAEDVLTRCDPAEGVWVDLGSGSGGLGLELAERSGSVIVLMDPDADALSRGLDHAREDALTSRVTAVVGSAERIPLPDASVALVVSRGSIFFWDDPVGGLREVHRILRPGGKAMIGGGLGSRYPQWAREVFWEHRLAAVRRQGAETLRRFEHVRSAETFRAWACEAGLVDFEVLTESPGTWLVFAKGGD